ncbi:MAG: hypothetical protein H7A05_03565 [Pseudomonadales bacterium]|nr:hypothetical protein [Pseudomonadales bacterium]MCP5329788.1 hypothetical protein [Pseudomonadales bacterium]MCP5343675.1 hypothetical protein [Pseudomonadales bacterium]
MDELIAIVALVIVGACFILPFYLRYQINLKELDTLTRLAEGGADVQTIINTLLKRRENPQSDKRRGLLLLAVAIPLIAFGVSQGEAYIALIFGGIPLLLGLAYLIMAKSKANTPQETQN